MKIQWRCEATEKIKKFGYVGNRLFYELAAGGWLLDYMDRQWHKCGTQKKAMEKANKLLHEWEDQLDSEPFCVVLDCDGWQKYCRITHNVFKSGRVVMEKPRTLQEIPPCVSDKILEPITIETITLEYKGRKKYGYPVFEL